MLSIQSHEVEGDSSLDLRLELGLNFLKCVFDFVVLIGVIRDIDDAQSAVTLQADVVGTVLTDEGDRCVEPGFRRS